MAIPTKLPIEFSCGHTETKDLADTPAGKRKSRAFGLGKNFVCTKCFKKQGKAHLEQLNQDALADAMSFETDHDLPELQGSEKQVNWATRIRFDVLNHILETRQSGDVNDEAHAQPDAVIETAKTLPHAGWWIDNFQDTSDLDVDDLIELITTAVDETAEDRLDTENPF